jgi:hypothetical protein
MTLATWHYKMPHDICNIKLCVILPHKICFYGILVDDIQSHDI